MRKLLLYVGLILVMGIQFYSCTSDELSGTQFSNQKPTVWLSSAPPEGSIASYTITLFWGGWDPDGEIDRFEYVITDNEGGIFNPSDTIDAWQDVVGNDSIFTFSADVFADSTNDAFQDGELQPFEFRRSHTFFIRAVDDHGARSDVVYRSFTSRTLSPTVFVEVPLLQSPTEAAQVPPVSTFRWVATDYISTLNQEQEPDWVRFILKPTIGPGYETTEDYIRNNPDDEDWSDWQWYRAQGDTGKVWTTPAMPFGPYVFAVQVRDEAGAVSPVFDLRRNMRRIQVSSKSTGPILTVSNEFIGILRTASPNAPLSIVDLPAGVPLQFCFRGDASSYGGTVSGYRYGWDILDLNDPDAWATSLTPFVGTEACSDERQFFFGSHTFYVEIIDNSGFPSRIGIRINVVPFTMENPILVIDDYAEGPVETTGWVKSNGVVPSDIEHDQFWADALNRVDGFNSQRDMIEVNSSTGIPIDVVARYQSIIWIARGDNSLPQLGEATVLRDIIAWRDPEQPAGAGKVQPNVAALFMAAGGHLMLAGDRIMTGAIPPGNFVYPIIFRYEIAGDQDGAYSGRSEVGVFGVGDNSFAYRDCCLNVLDIGILSGNGQVRRPPNQQVPPGTGCPVNQMRDHRKTNPPNSITDGIRSVTRATTATFAWPDMVLRQEAAGPGRWYQPNVGSGLNTDVYNPWYFNDLTACGGPGGVAETEPLRQCFQPIYSMICENTSSNIYGSTVAFWTTTYADRIPDVGGVAARSCVWGFDPVYMEPAQFKQALELIVFDEWQLPCIDTPCDPSS